MSGFKGYRCWTPEVVTETIATEAAAPSDAVLLATHTPLHIRKQSFFGSGAEAAQISERDLVHEFLNSPARDGVLIASIVGESGSGKSHLIRWAEANIPKKPGRHVIPLRRIDTSLRDVVEALLLDRDGPQFAEIRQQLHRLGEAVEPAALARRLIDNLAEALLTAEARDPFEKSLVGEKGLQLLLHDPVFRAHILRDGGFVQRRIDHALNGRDAEAPDVPLQFTVDDLPLDITQSISLKTAAAPTQAVFSRLSSTPQIQSAAVTLMNEYLDVAVMKAANLDVGNLQRAFMQVRKELAGDEIVLLIEDVALIQGVRRDLLDAIIEVGVVRGKTEYATVRTMLAVTPAYYLERLPETFRTRSEASSPVYVVDLDMAPVQDDDGRVFVDFLGRYLNAARVGRQALDAAPHGDVPNACTNCKYVNPCHEAFGRSSNGFGLYPYNEAAALAVVKASAAPAHPQQFNPRRVLHRAVKQALTVHSSDLPTGKFPSPEFRSEFNTALLPGLSLGVRADLEDRYEQDEALRYETLLEFWGAAGTAPIAEGVWQAFSLQPIEIGDDPQPTPVVQKDDPPGDRSTAIPPALARRLEEIEAWSRGESLTQNASKDLRALIRDAIVSRIEWTSPPMKEPPGSVLDKALPRNARTVGIEGAHQGMALSEPPLVEISRSPRTAKFFRELLLVEAGVERRAGAVLELDRLADEYAARAQAKVIAYLEVSEPALISVAASLVRGSALLGLLPSSAKPSDLVSAVLSAPAGPQRLDGALRVRAWLDSETPYCQERASVVRAFREAVGISQGVTGEVHAVDRVRLERLLKAARRLADDPATIELPSWAQAADRKFRVLEATLDVQTQRWVEVVGTVRSLVPSGESYVDTVDALSVAVRDGVVPGLILVNDLPSLNERIAAARSLDFSALTALERLLERLPGSTGLERLALLGSDVGSDVTQIHNFLVEASGWVDTGLAVAQGRAGESASDVDAEIAQTVKSWLAVAEELNDVGE